MADWAELNHDVLIEIAERLPSKESYEYFGRVCRSWKAAARKGHLKQTIFEVPWLMFAEKDENNQESVESVRQFSSVSLGITKTINIYLPEASKRSCVSCKDWLLVSSQDEINVWLLHPLSRVQIHLPKLTTLSFYHITGVSHFIEKAVLSANPTTTSDFIVMVICGLHRRLAFWKSGDTSWTSIDFWEPCQFYDIMYCNNKLYGVDALGTIVTCDIHGPNPTQLLQLFPNFSRQVDCDKAYLVELPGGKFLMARRYVDFPTERSYQTTGFKVFEVNNDDGTLVEIKDLVNKALFLGYNSSFYIECSEFNKCKPNCIYFTEDIMDFFSRSVSRDSDEIIGGGKDMGIYDISDGSIRSFFDDEDIVCSRFTPPTWIGPNL